MLSAVCMYYDSVNIMLICSVFLCIFLIYFRSKKLLFRSPLDLICILIWMRKILEGKMGSCFIIKGPHIPPHIAKNKIKYCTVWLIHDKSLIISPNEVFGDIMVLASPPRPPVDPDDVKNTLTRQIFSLSLSNFI